jgi:SAM-dependent methyltransferase
MVQQAQQLNPEIHFREGNMLELALDDISLAGIAAFYAIVNLRTEWLAQVFREMARVLMPSGLLLLAFHTGDRVVQVNEMWGRAIAMEFFFFDPESIRRKLEAAGFVVEHVIERRPYAPEVEHQSHRAYIFARKPCA